MSNTEKSQVVNRVWVAEAAARAEARSQWKGEAVTPLSHAHSQVQRLIGAIMDDRVTRRELRQIAKSVSEGQS